MLGAGASRLIPTTTTTTAKAGDNELSQVLVSYGRVEEFRFSSFAGARFPILPHLFPTPLTPARPRSWSCCKFARDQSDKLQHEFLFRPRARNDRRFIDAGEVRDRFTRSGYVLVLHVALPARGRLEDLKLTTATGHVILKFLGRSTSDFSKRFDRRVRTCRARDVRVSALIATFSPRCCRSSTTDIVGRADTRKRGLPFCPVVCRANRYGE